MRSRARAALFSFILILLAVSVAISLQKTVEQGRVWQTARLERSPQFLHVERMQVAAAQAALDALALSAAPSNLPLQADYRSQRMQLRADWMGMEHLAERDPQRQGLLLEIRSSLADFLLALDQMAASTAPSSANDSAHRNDPAHLLLALRRVETALSNDSGSLEQSAARAAAQPTTAWFRSIWISLLLLLLVCAALMVVLECTRRRNTR
jgi:hypothetical protein